MSFEDNYENILLLGIFIKRLGYNHKNFENYIEGLKYINKNSENISIILMDKHLPNINGIELIKIIKMKSPKIPIILQSASISAKDIRNAKNFGCDDYIEKPIIEKILINKIKNLL